jgi:hypothetical protein
MRSSDFYLLSGIIYTAQSMSQGTAIVFALINLGIACVVGYREYKRR